MKAMPAIGWASTWAFGAALGVAVGGYLTLVSGTGAPGQAAIDPATDLLVLPLVAFAIVFCVHLGGQLVAGVLRARRRPGPICKADHDNEQSAE